MKTNQHNTTIVTRIRNRNAIFADSLPNWLQFDMPIIVVDYRDDSCESAYEVVTAIPATESVTVIETKYEYMFLLSHAWNIGISQVQTENILLFDVDNIMLPNFFTANTLVENSAIVGMLTPDSWHLTGICFTATEIINRVGGFNENMVYMGHHDIDLYNRMHKAGCKLYGFATGTAIHKDHPRHMNTVNQWVDTNSLSDEVHYNVYETMNELNRRIAEHLPWSFASRRVEWNLTKIANSRFLAERKIQ